MVSQNMLIWAGVAFLFFYASVASGTSISSQKTSLVVSNNNQVKNLFTKFPKIQIDDFECQICVQFAVVAINNWMNDYLQRIMPGACDQLCQIVSPNDTNYCFFMCHLHGFFGFIEFIKGVDINPIYMCQHPSFHNGCLVADCTTPNCVQIAHLEAEPKQVYRNQDFTISGVWEVNQIVGAGSVSLLMTLDSKPSYQRGPMNLLVPSFQPGAYRAEYALNAEDFLHPGTYTAQFTVCEGYCGSKYPHTKVLDSRNISFTILL